MRIQVTYDIDAEDVLNHLLSEGDKLAKYTNLMDMLGDYIDAQVISNSCLDGIKIKVIQN